ncbi:MAG TPA: response regulator transcription factor [Prolixibacteraceae bacterium]|jgi:YesN/AraC family two-component response regulator|nr:response regulator transcription factor [Prolixibacteraceae bacterium]
MEQKLKYLIVEDEAKSRETLLQKIEMCNIPNIVCTGMAANSTEAMMLAKLTPPDFILLDINLPGKNGFELIEELKSINISPQVIFTSAHTESSILLDALKKSPVTYLTKPIDLDDLEEAIRKVILLIKNEKPNKTNDQKIKLNAYSGPIYLYADQIMMVKSELHQSKLYFNDGECILLNQNIGSFEKDHPLCELPFFRADRSTILNLKHVEQFFPKKGQCTLRSGNNIVVAEMSQNGLKKIMEIIEAGY